MSRWSFSLSFILLLILLGCRKTKLDCKGNCGEIKFAGRIINKATGAPISNLEVNAILYKNRCAFCTSYKIGSARSGSDGRFYFTSTIDTTKLKENNIVVSMKTPGNFILYPEPVGPGISNDPTYSNEAFYDLDRGRMENIFFELYPKILLTVKLHRTTPISPQKSLGLEFILNDRISNWGINESISNADTSLTIYTSANLYTKIISRKFVSADSVVSTIDSVYCLPNVKNAINISY